MNKNYKARVHCDNVLVLREQSNYWPCLLQTITIISIKRRRVWKAQKAMPRQLTAECWILGWNVKCKKILKINIMRVRTKSKAQSNISIRRIEAGTATLVENNHRTIKGYKHIMSTCTPSHIVNKLPICYLERHNYKLSHSE